MGAQCPYLPGTPPRLLGRQDGGGWEVSFRGESRENSRSQTGVSSYLGALVQQSLRHGPADALRRAGHQRHFAVHVHGAAAAGRPAPPQLLWSRRAAPRPAPSCLRVGGEEAVGPAGPRAVSPCPERSREPSRARDLALCLPDSSLNPGHRLPSPPRAAALLAASERTGKAGKGIYF